MKHTIPYDVQVVIDAAGHIFVSLERLRWLLSNQTAHELWCRWRCIRRTNFQCYGSE